MLQRLPALRVVPVPLLLLSACATVPDPPASARIEPVVETRYGVTLQDPYRWMEKAGNADELNQWLIEQSAYTEATLAGLPERTPLYERLLDLYREGATAAAVTLRRDQLFYLETAAGESLRKLVHRDAAGHRRVLYDPATSPGGNDAVTTYSVSPDARTVAVNITTNGSEYSTIRFVDVATGTFLDDRIDSIWGEFFATWTPDSKAVYYVQLNPQALADPAIDNLVNMQTYRHRLGSGTDSDEPVFVRSSPAAALLKPEEFPVVERHPDSDWETLIGFQAHPTVHVLLRKSGTGEAWTEVAGFDDRIAWAAVWKNTLYLLDHSVSKQSRILALDLDRHSPTLANARVVYATDALNVMFMVAAKDALYLLGDDEGISRLLRVPHDGGPVEMPPMPFEGAIDDLRGYADEAGVTFAMEEWNTPKAYYRYGSSLGFQSLALVKTADKPKTEFVVRRISATSADGTDVPVTVIHRKGLHLDGKRPTILYGYGAYGVTLQPFYDPAKAAWTERDGVYAYAHVRGGGLRGPEWHRAGSGVNKMNGIADFIAAAEALIAAGYTTRDRIAAYGGSMGGILIGRAITERPDLFRAASIHVGALNALRILAQDNGANQKAELGYTDDEQGFHTLLAQDAYQNLARGVAYPSTLLTLGLNDRRVSPWVSAKFAARLADYSSNPLPMLLRVDAADGHGLLASREQRAARMADVYSFFLNRFGEAGFVP